MYRIMILFLFISACSPMNEFEYKKHRMEKEGKRMFKKVQRARKYGRR